MKQRMTTVWGPIISESELAQLATYKYSSYDYSLIANYILKYYWNGCVHLFPLWLAPNLITLLGLCFVLANFFLMAYYIPDLRTSAPSWVYYL